MKDRHEQKRIAHKRVLMLAAKKPDNRRSKRNPRTVRNGTRGSVFTEQDIMVDIVAEVGDELLEHQFEWAAAESLARSVEDLARAACDANGWVYV